MSEETKLCPYFVASLTSLEEVTTRKGMLLSEWATCLEDKCAMWREVFSPAKVHFEEPGKDTTGIGQIVVDEPSKKSGYCGLAGKP